MRIIEGMVLPTGWHFMHDGTTRIEAATYKELLQAVLEWRLQNRVPVGNVSMDVERYICSKFPQQCQGGQYVTMAAKGGKKSPVAPSQKRSDGLTQWALALMKQNGVSDHVVEQEANGRAMTCIGCPKNIKWPQTCARCHDELERLLTMLRSAKDVTHWRKLNICYATQQDCRTIVWIRKDLLRTENVPTNCWLK